MFPLKISSEIQYDSGKEVKYQREANRKKR